jgi:serine/threonine protein kinase/WD40 repeat protein
MLAKYRIERRLGAGGMGVAWLAVDTVAEVQVVIKVLPPELQRDPAEMKRVKETYQRVHALQHPNICGTRDLRHDEGVGYFIVLNFIPGQTLSEVIANHRLRRKPIDLLAALAVLRPVAWALDFAHRKHVVHRDIKPGNIMVGRTSEGVLEVQVIDFGLAADIRSSVTRISQKRMETAGTYPYMAPEQWRGRYQDGQTDQYALAVVAYELLSGRLPFDAPDTEVLRQCVLNEEPEPIQGQPDHVNQALARGLAKNREDRFPTCTAFIEALFKGAAPAEPPETTTGSEESAAATKPRVRIKLPSLKPLAQAIVRLKPRIRIPRPRVRIPKPRPFTVALVLMVLAVVAMLGVLGQEAWRSIFGDPKQAAEIEDVPEPPTDPPINGGPKSGTTAPGRTGSRGAASGGESEPRPGPSRPPPKNAGPSGSLQTFDADLGTVWSVAISPDGANVLTGVGGKTSATVTSSGIVMQSKGNCAIFWDAQTGDQLWMTPPQKSDVRSVAFPSQGRVVAASEDRTAALWNMRGKLERDLTDQLNSMGGAPASVADIERAQRQSQAERSRSFGGGPFQSQAQADLDRALGFSSSATSPTRGQITSITIDPHGHILVCFQTGEATFWKSDPLPIDQLWRKRQKFQLPGDGVFPVSVHAFAAAPDGENVLVVDSTNEAATMWSVASGKERWRYKGDPIKIRAVAVSPDGDRALVGASDGKVAILNAKTGGELTTMTHEAPVNGVAFSADGAKVLSGSDDKTAVLWEAATGRKLRTFRGHTQSVTSVAFGPKGATALTGSADGSAILWDANVTATVAAVGAINVPKPQGEHTPAAATAPAAPQKYFGDIGTLPEQVMTLSRKIVYWEKHPSYRQNQLAAREIRSKHEAELKDVIGRNRGKTVTARLAVTDVTADEVWLYPDVTWGWPTQSPFDFTPETELDGGYLLPRFGIILLDPTQGLKNDRIALRVDKDIPAAVAARLAWNDKLVVTFRIDDVKQVEARNVIRAKFVLSIDELKFVREHVDEAVAGLRSSAWPARGTFPDWMRAFDMDAANWRGVPIEHEFSSFCEYAGATLRRGTASLRVKRVTEEAVELQSQVSSKSVAVFLRGENGRDLSIPLDAVGRQRAAQLTSADSLPVHFEIAEITSNYSGGFSGDPNPDVYVTAKNLSTDSAPANVAGSEPKASFGGAPRGRGRPDRSQTANVPKLSGTWMGEFQIRSQQPVPFELTVVHDESTGRITGRVKEPNTFGRTRNRWTFAKIDGVFNSHDRTLKFNKQYVSEGDANYTLTYDGQVTPDGDQASGTWTMPDGQSGPFEIRREKK